MILVYKKEEFINFLLKNGVKYEAINVFLELLEEDTINKRFGISAQDINNLCIIKQIINKTNICAEKIVNTANNYFKDFVSIFLELFCNFHEETIYKLIIKSIETGFSMEKDKIDIFEFYKSQNMLHTNMINILKEQSQDINIFELVASLIKFSNFASGILSLAYYEKFIADQTDSIYKKSITDQLSGLYNRFKLEEIKSTEFHRSKRYQIPLSICVMDIDNFKLINDTYGHQTGDEVIKTIGDIILNNIRKGDIPIRWGGEEFLIIFTHTNINGALLACEKLKKTIEQTKVKKDDKEISFTVSIGLSSMTNEDKSIEDAIERADSALYKAKLNGKNRIEIYTELKEGIPKT